jgi:hypothetical protein
MLKGKNRELADLFEQYIKRYEVLLERRYNVGEVLTKDELQWMKDFNHPERQIQGIYYQLRRTDDPYIDMILNRFESLQRKEHGLQMVQKVRESSVHNNNLKGKSATSLESFFETQHRDTDRLVNDLILAIHKKSGGISPTVMNKFVTQIRDKVEGIKKSNAATMIQVKAAINRNSNQIEIVVEPVDSTHRDER